MGCIPPLQATDWAPGSTAKQTFRASSGASSGTAVIDAAAIPAGKTIAVKTLTVNGAGTGGAGQTFKILADADVTIQTGGGGSITIGSDDIAVIGFEWVGSSSHADFAQHPYTIKAVRGKLEVSNGQLVIAEKPALAQYIQTTPLSQEQAT